MIKPMINKILCFIFGHKKTLYPLPYGFTIRCKICDKSFGIFNILQGEFNDAINKTIQELKKEAAT